MNHDLRDTRQGYALWAPSYDAADNPLIGMTVHAMNEWNPSLEGLRVLELGCGTGRNAPFFLERGAAEYVGIDGSAEMLARAEERRAAAPWAGRARFVQGDVAAPIDASLGSFDVIFVCLVLEHMQDVAPTLHAAAGAARAGAELRAYELHPTLHAAGTRAHVRVGDRDVALPSYAHDRAELVAALERAGFTDVRIVDLVATEETCRASAKLRKHLGRAVALEISARRR